MNRFSVLLLALLLSAPCAQAAVLALPGAGPAVAVVDTLARDGFEQRIRFGGGDGGNLARIAVRAETADLLLAFPTDLSRPNEVGIQGELRSRFPGAAMRIVPPRRNAYGPVGMALGADCLYAWQWIDLSPAMLASAGNGLFGRLSAPNPVAGASIRVRLCRTERATLSDLIGAVERMHLDLSDAPRARTGVAIGAPRAPAPVRRAARPRPTGVARAAASSSSERQDRPQPSPAPSSTDATDRRYIVPLTEARPTSPSAPENPDPAPVPDRRSSSRSPGPTYLVPGSVGQKPENGVRPFGDLPSQAYDPSTTRRP